MPHVRKIHLALKQSIARKNEVGMKLKDNAPLLVIILGGRNEATVKQG